MKFSRYSLNSLLHTINKFIIKGEIRWSNYEEFGFTEFEGNLSNLVCETINDKHTELGIPEDRIGFIQKSGVNSSTFIYAN